jgi:hypothetical protein
MRHGFATIFSSSKATLKIVRRRRYALAGCPFPGWSFSACVFQRRTNLQPGMYPADEAMEVDRLTLVP